MRHWCVQPSLLTFRKNELKVLKFAPLPLRSQMALLFSLLSAIVGLPTYWYISSQHQQQLIVDKRQALQALSHSAATILSENLAERRREMELLAQTPLYRQGSFDNPEFQASVERVKRSYPHYAWIGIVDTQGRVQAATSGHLVGADVTGRPWFKEGLKGAYIGDVHEAVLLAKVLPRPASDQPLRFIDFAAPILDGAGRLRGVVAAHADWQWAGAMLSVVAPEFTIPDSVDLFILDRKGAVIFPEKTPAGLEVPPLYMLTRAWSRSFLEWGEGMRYLTSSATLQSPEVWEALGWRVVARQAEDTVVDEVRVLQRINLLAIAGAGVVFLLLIGVVANRISRPVATLTQTARRIERGEEHVRFSEKFRAVELQRLSDALRGMSGTLIRQKEALARTNQDLEAKVAERTAELQKLNTELVQLARTDALTGLPNRLSVNERLAQEFSRFKRSGAPYSVLVLDIDHFKHVNDTHGHAVGDDVLKQVATTLQASVRATDFVGRSGGEEFLAILPMTPASQAMEVAEKIRRVIAAAPVPPVGDITISIGVQQVAPEDANEDIAVVHADDWLYQAKAAGRNRVMGGVAPGAMA